MENYPSPTLKALPLDAGGKKFSWHDVDCVKWSQPPIYHEEIIRHLKSCQRVILQIQTKVADFG